MACSLNTIKSDSLREVRRIIKGDAKVVSFTKKGDALITPSKDSAKVKTKGNARRMAESKVDAVNKWSKDTFNTDAYTGQWLSITEGPNDFRLAITFPKSLERDYQKKIARDEAREVQMQDSQRAGIDPEFYSDDYLFDDLPVSADGYNYGLYLDNKEKMRDYFNQRINVLSEMSNKTKKDFKQIAEFKEIVSRLSQDIKHLQKEDAILENFFNYFHRDLDTIEEVLFEDVDSLDNLMGARNFIDMMKFVYGFDKSNNEKYFSDVFYQKLDDSSEKLFKDFKDRLSAIDDKLTEAELTFTSKGVNAILLDKNVEDYSDEDIVRLKEQVKGVSQLSAWLLPIDSDMAASPLQVFVRKVYDDAVGRKETFNLRQKLKNIQTKLESKLKADGKTTNSGILGKLFSSVNYDVFKRKTATGRNRIAGKYSNRWFSLKDAIDKQFGIVQNTLYKKNKDVEDYNKIKQTRRKIFDTLKANEVNFIDVRYIPELLEDADLQANFSNFFKSKDEADEYKENLIQSLIGESGNRAVAEKMYNQIVEEQLHKLYEFEISIEQYTKRLYKKNGVNQVSDLPEKDRNNLLSMYYTQSPFSFAEAYQTNGNSNVAKLYYKDGEQKSSVDVHTMEYISYLPTQNAHFDSQFEKEIASDETMYEAWEMFDDALKYINRNRKYAKRYDEKEFDDSLTYELDMVHKHNDSLVTLGKYYVKSTLERIGHVLSTSKYRDKVDMKMNGTIKSLDEVVKSRMKPIMAVANTKGFRKKGVQKKEDIPQDLVVYLEKRFDIVLPDVVHVQKLIKEYTEKEILDEQQLNLIDTLTNQLEIVEKFKAKKEIENQLLFAKNQIKRVVESSNKPVEQKHAIKLVESFISRHLYDINNRANWNYYQQGPNNWRKVYTVHEKELRKDIKASIEAIKELSKDASAAVKKQAAEDIAELEAFMESQGRDVTTGSLFEAGLIRLSILVGLGLNVPSQMKNWLVGNLAGRQNDGLEWTEGNFLKASSYTRKWKIAKRKLSKKDKQRHRLTNTFIDNLGIFQNSANELDKVKESDYHNQLRKFISNPLHIVGEMEKTIQRPQILAMMGDIMVKDVNGNEVPAFDVNNLKNPHPAFKLDSDGNLTLKEDFDTKENRDTWINRNSQEYANLFGESGKVPTMIAKINGDYRDTSTTGIKETSIGSLAMMFKTWLPAFILRRYGKKDGVIRNLVEDGRGSETLGMSSVTASLYTAIGAGILFSPIVGMGIGAVILGRQKMRHLIREDMLNLEGIMKEIQKSMFGLKFATNLVRYSGATAVKMVQQQTDLIFGDRFISNDLVSDIAGFKQKKGESDSEFEKNKARLQFLATEAATTLQLLLLKLLVNAMLFPDDDERDEFNRAEGYDKIKKQPDVYAYYFLENMLSGFSDDMNLMNDPLQMGKIALAGSSADGYNKMATLLGSIGDQYMKGDYTRGENAGENRIGVNLGKVFVPKGLFDTSLGMYRTGQRDYKPKDPVNVNFLTDFKSLDAERLKQRSKKKQELKDKYKEDYKGMSDDKIEKKVQKQLSKEFPTIKKYFNEDGSIIEGKEHKVEKYK